MFTSEFFEQLTERLNEENSRLQRMVGIKIFTQPVVTVVLRDGSSIDLAFLGHPLKDDILTATAYKENSEDLKVVCIPYSEIMRVEAFEPRQKGRKAMGFRPQSQT